MEVRQEVLRAEFRQVAFKSWGMDEGIQIQWRRIRLRDRRMGAVDLKMIPVVGWSLER